MVFTKYKTREKIFNKIMVTMRRILYIALKLDRHINYVNHRNNEGYIPVLYVNPFSKEYRFGCYCFDCPCNYMGICATEFQEIPYKMMHDFDDDNIIKNNCG